MLRSTSTIEGFTFSELWILLELLASLCWHSITTEGDKWTFHDHFVPSVLRDSDGEMKWSRELATSVQVRGQVCWGIFWHLERPVAWSPPEQVLGHYAFLHLREAGPCVNENILWSRDLQLVCQKGLGRLAPLQWGSRSFSCNEDSWGSAAWSSPVLITHAELCEEMRIFTPVWTASIVASSHPCNKHLHLCWAWAITSGSVFTAAKGGLCKVCRLRQNCLSHTHLFIREAITMFIVFPLSISERYKH